MLRHHQPQLSGDTNILLYTDLFYAVVPPYAKEEIDVRLRVGTIFAGISRVESGLLVRREVANAVAEFTQFQKARFVRAAPVMEMCGEDGLFETKRNFDR